MTKISEKETKTVFAAPENDNKGGKQLPPIKKKCPGHIRECARNIYFLMQSRFLRD